MNKYLLYIILYCLSIACTAQKVEYAYESAKYGIFTIGTYNGQVFLIESDLEISDDLVKILDRQFQDVIVMKTGTPLTVRPDTTIPFWKFKYLCDTITQYHQNKIKEL
jgi:hypothetical protein